MPFVSVKPFLSSPSLESYSIDHIRNADCTAVERCQSGGQGQVLASTMPRAPNRAAQGSTLK